MQAGTLIEALAVQRRLELAEAFVDAWEVGPKWRERLESGMERIGEAQDALRDSLARWLDSRRGKARELSESLPF